MSSQKSSAQKLWATLALIVCGYIGPSFYFSENKLSPFEFSSLSSSLSEDEGAISRALISQTLGVALNGNQLPEKLNLDVDGDSVEANVSYALDMQMQERMEKLVRSYGPDYGAFVAMDAQTGRILSLVSYTREDSNLGHLALRASFPAASIFKVITASAALEKNKAHPGTVVQFNGSNTSLYKQNVRDTRVNRWTRHMTMREAFGRSVNTVFGKLGLFYVGPAALLEYAERFHFNRPIRADVPIQTGYAHIDADDYWSVVTAASGFTQDNTMSPVQGAMIAAAVANDGIMMDPYLVNTLSDASGEILYQVEPRKGSTAIEPDSAAELRSMMRETVRNGTSRKSFRQIVHRDRFMEGAELGGKTGSLSGKNPTGRCDWFVGYMRFKGARIAVAALTVNQEKWRVKSSTLASTFFQDYGRLLNSREVAANIKTDGFKTR